MSHAALNGEETPGRTTGAAFAQRSILREITGGRYQAIKLEVAERSSPGIALNQAIKTNENSVDGVPAHVQKIARVCTQYTIRYVTK